MLTGPKNWVRHQLLIDLNEWLKDTQISEKTINQVVEWYDRKVEMLREFQLEIPVSIIFSIQDGERFIFPYYNYDAMIKEALDREIPLIREHSFTFFFTR